MVSRSMMTVGRSAALGVALLVGGAALDAATSSPAEARTFVSVGFGFPLFPGPYYYPPAYYPAPAYYYPPPVYPASVYVPPAAVTAAPTISWDYCREYQATQTIGGQPQNVVGTACRQPDGSWRIVQ
jgi:hypothetical protein